MNNKPSFFSNISVNQILQFGWIGLMTNIIGYLLFLFCTLYLKFSPYLVISFLYPLAITATYILNKKRTFKQAKEKKNQKILFIIIYLSGYLLNIIILYIATTIFFLSSYLAQGLAIIVLGIYLFLMQKKYVYV
jgi:putative flippase GtrA|tara:strand:- start:71 stop:472 length:402 start_codon:yes stop_codon:yes gene_type:complete